MPIQSNIAARSIHPKHRIGSATPGAVAVNAGTGLTREQVIGIINTQRPADAGFGWNFSWAANPDGTTLYTRLGNIEFDDNSIVRPAGVATTTALSIAIRYDISITGHVYELIGGNNVVKANHSEAVWDFRINQWLNTSPSPTFSHNLHAYNGYVPASGQFGRFNNRGDRYGVSLVRNTYIAANSNITPEFWRFTIAQSLITAPTEYWGIEFTVNRTIIVSQFLQ